MKLPFPLPRLTAIIGGGGKTTLMYALGRRAAAEGKSVLLTTTTHLAWPPPGHIPYLAPADEGELWAAVRPGQAVLAGYPAGQGRMTGLSPSMLERACSHFDCVICEADGSRGLSLKWHREDEPCVPPGTDLLLQVAGLSALDRPAGEVLHRWKAAGYEEDHHVTEADVIHLVRRAFAHCGETDSKTCLLNQADTLADEGRGERIAQALAAGGISCGVCVLKEEDIRCWY